MKWAARFKLASLPKKSIKLLPVLRDKCFLTRQARSSHSIRNELLSISLSRGENCQMLNGFFIPASAWLCAAAKLNHSVRCKWSRVVSMLESHDRLLPFACRCKRRVRLLGSYTYNP